MDEQRQADEDELMAWSRMLDERNRLALILTAAMLVENQNA